MSHWEMRKVRDKWKSTVVWYAECKQLIISTCRYMKYAPSQGERVGGSVVCELVALPHSCCGLPGNRFPWNAIEGVWLIKSCLLSNKIMPPSYLHNLSYNGQLHAADNYVVMQ